MLACISYNPHELYLMMSLCHLCWLDLIVFLIFQFIPHLYFQLLLFWKYMQSYLNPDLVLDSVLRSVSSQNLLLDKSEIRLLAGIFYSRFRYHQHILGNVENKLYRYCNITDETSEYVLCIISHKDKVPRGSHLKKYHLAR